MEQPNELLLMLALMANLPVAMSALGLEADTAAEARK
jgi:hypothetical protein